MDTDLSQRLIDLARELQAETHLNATAQTVTREVVTWLGADTAAGITMVRRQGRVENLAATSDVPAAVTSCRTSSRRGPVSM